MQNEKLIQASNLKLDLHLEENLGEMPRCESRDVNYRMKNYGGIF